MLLQHSKTNCSFDELTVDCLHNQIIYTRIHRLLAVKSLGRMLSLQLKGLTRDLKGISQELNTLKRPRPQNRGGRRNPTVARPPPPRTYTATWKTE